MALVDLTLPVLDGFEVAQRLREMPETRSCRLVAMTGWSDDDCARRTRAAGFDAHLVKPIPVDTLLRTLAANGAVSNSPPPAVRRSVRPSHAELR